MPHADTCSLDGIILIPVAFVHNNILARSHYNIYSAFEFRQSKCTPSRMESNATILRRHQETPLASCEARARLAMERGELSRAAYRSLMGITAEVLLARRAEEGGGSSGEATGRKQITPCGTPPVRGGEEEEQLPLPLRLTTSPSTEPRMPENYIAIHGDKEAGDQCQEEYSIGFESSALSPSVYAEDTPGADSDRLLLEKMNEQGFSLSSRAARFWSQEGSSDDQSSTMASREEDDQRLLQFVDICLKTCPPSSRSKTPDPSIFSRDIAWQKRLGLIVQNPTIKGGVRIESENARWEAKFEKLLKFKAAYRHCNVPFRYHLNKSLGGWVQKQRDFHKRGKLPKPRFKRLNEAGFSWVLSNKRIPKINDDSIHSYEDLWDFRYKSLTEFKASHGHCNVPYRYSKDSQLGRWVQNQREFHKRGTLSSKRHRRLEEIGFSWSIRKGGKKGSSNQNAKCFSAQNT